MTDKELRKKSGFTAQLIAMIACTVKSTIYAWEKDNNYPESLRIKLLGLVTDDINKKKEASDLIREERAAFETNWSNYDAILADLESQIDEQIDNIEGY